MISPRRILLSAVLCFGLLSSGYAQQNTSALSGMVSTPAGAATAASVTATNEASGRVRKTTATNVGTYAFPSLEPAPYTVTFESAGFGTLNVTGVDVAVARRSVVNATLETGSQNRMIAASSLAGEPLESASAALSSDIAPALMGQAPLFVLGGLRNEQTFVSYLGGNANGYLENNVAGGIRRGKDVLIDGASAASSGEGGITRVFPTGGQLGEFRVLTSALPAEYGRTSGAVEVWATRAGGNVPHGSVFEFLRNDALDAAGWAVNSIKAQKPKLRQNEYGFNLGGPVFIPEVLDGRNKSFFNVAFNDYKQNDVNVSTLLTIPTVAMRNGDFSRLVDSTGKQIPIYDPATQTDRGQGLVRDPYTQNRIPPSTFSAVSKKILNYLPDPSNNQNTNNYLGLFKAAIANFDLGFRGDQMISDNSRISVYGTYYHADNNTTGPLPGVITSGNRQYDRSQLFRLTYDTTKNANQTSQTTLSYNWTKNRFDRQPDQLQNWSRVLGLNGVDNGGSSSFPVVNFTGGYASLGRYTDLATRGGLFDRTLAISHNQSKIRGRHELKMGFDARLGRTFQSQVIDSGVQGVFNFANFQTALPSARATTGNSFASFLLGAVDSGSRVFTSVAPDYRNIYAAGYLQDHFSMSSRLTLEVGLRYDLPIGRSDNNNSLSSFDPNLANPGAGGRKGALAIAGKGTGHTGNNRFGDLDKTEIAPRIGVAYRVNDKTVVRGGFGLLYAYGNGLTTAQCALCSLGATAVVQEVSNGLNQAFNWDTGLLPQASFRQPPVLDPASANGGPILYVDPNNGQAPRFLNYSIGVQRQLPMSARLDVVFAGSHGDRLSGAIPLNQADPKYLAQGALLALPITDARVRAAGFLTPYTGFTGTLAQSLRPYPQFGDITDPYSATLHSDYKSLQVRMERRSGPMLMQANYTWSRATSDGAVSMALNSLLSPQNQYNPGAQESRQIDDIPQALNLVYSVELPVGHGKRFMGSARGPLNAVISGWSIAAEQQYRSGNLLVVTAPNLLGNGVLSTTRTAPNVVAGQAFRTATSADSLDPNNPSNRWLNPAAFSLPQAFTFGNAPNLSDDVRNPSFRVENFSVIKKTTIHQRLNLEYRVDLQNAFNRSLFGNINTNVASPGFGRATGTMIQPRIVQMALRLAF